jgi:SAM-dependent methyltransferase
VTFRRTREPRDRDRELDAGSRAHYEDADYYTATYRGRIDDVQHYVGVATRLGGPVLEYGVGNGRIALPIARHGHAVTGVDHVKAMLDDLRARLRDEPAEVRARVAMKQGDMRSVDLRERFPLVICPFNAALHLYVRRDVERFLARVRAHLRPRGRFVCDLSVPIPKDLARNPARAYSVTPFRHPSDGRLVENREYFDYDRVRQVLFVSMEFEPVGKPREAWMTPLAHRQFFPQEWEALLHYNGFEVEDVYGDFHGGPLDRASDVMVWHARLRRGWSSRERGSGGEARGRKSP